MSVLIRAPFDDLHSWAVRWAMHEKSSSCDFWDLTSFPANSRLSSRISNENHLDFTMFSTESNDVDFSKYHTIWSRRGGKLTHVNGLPDGDLKYAETESRFYLSSLHVLLSNSVNWVNNPIAQIVANQKLHQLQVAQRSGLLIPETIASNDPEQVRAFAKKYGPDIVFKPFEIGMWRGVDGDTSHYISYASKISQKDLEDDLAIQAAPGIYQQAVQKQFDIRLLVAGATYLAVKIVPATNGKAGIDWRADKLATMEPYIISDQTFDRILKLMASLGIVTGSVDMVVDIEGKCHFIEVNESGQFLFMEENCKKLPVLDMFSSFLTNPTSDFCWSAHSRQAAQTVSLENFYKSQKFVEFNEQTKNITPSNSRPML